MSKEYSIQEIRSALNAWAKLITPLMINGEPYVNYDSILRFLNQGFCIEITSRDVTDWSLKLPAPSQDLSSPDSLSPSIHAYPAIFENELKFVLIDCLSDKKIQSTTENIKVKSIGFLSDSMQIESESSDPPLPAPDAVQRRIMWDMYSKVWLQSVVSSRTGIFQAFDIPFEDFLNLDTPSGKIQGDIYGFLGLKCESAIYSAEFILGKQDKDYKMPDDFYNISRPVPPFGNGLYATDFRLMPMI